MTVTKNFGRMGCRVNLQMKKKRKRGKEGKGKIKKYMKYRNMTNEYIGKQCAWSTLYGKRHRMNIIKIKVS